MVFSPEKAKQFIDSFNRLGKGCTEGTRRVFRLEDEVVRLAAARLVSLNPKGL